MDRYSYHTRHSLWSRFWRDRHGRLVIWQTPNPLLLGWAGSTFLSLLVNGQLANALYWVGSAILILWSLLEIFKGVNYFRRLLGLVVLILSIMSSIKSL